MAVNWTKAKHMYVTTTASYRKVAEKYGCAANVVAERGKKEGWVKARREYREKMAAKALEEAQKLDIDRLKRLQDSSMKMCERLEKAINDDDELYIHAGVEGMGMGESRITERKLTSIDAQKARVLCESLRTMTQVMRNLFDIHTKAQEQQLLIAREKAQMEKEKHAKDMVKEETDNELVITLSPQAEAYAK